MISRLAWATLKGWESTVHIPYSFALVFCSALGIFVVPMAPPSLSSLDCNLLLIQQKTLPQILALHTLLL